MVFAKNLAKNAPANPEREAKIQELKERIARKEYNVKPDDVAERLIKEHRDTKEMG